MGRPPAVVTELVRGKRRVTAATALDLEAALRIPASIWLNLQARYDLVTYQQRRKASYRLRSSKRAGRSATRGRDDVMYYMLLYDYVPDVLERRAPFREQHLALLTALHEKGQVPMAGALD